MTFQLKIHSAPDVRGDEAFALIPNARQSIILFCDGSVSWEYGDQAAQLALIRLCSLWLAREFLSLERICQEVEMIGTEVASIYRDEVFGESSFSMVVMIISGDEVRIAHAGVYDAALIRDGKILAKTPSQTMAARLLAEGQDLTEENKNYEAMYFIHGGPIIGQSGNQTPWITDPWQLMTGDQLVIGDRDLFRKIPEDELLQKMNRREDSNPALAIQRCGVMNSIAAFPVLVVQIQSAVR